MCHSVRKDLPCGSRLPMLRLSSPFVIDLSLTDKCKCSPVLANQRKDVCVCVCASCACCQDLLFQAFGLK
eukprot:5617427-Amphidinium_carterae.1